MTLIRRLLFAAGCAALIHAGFVSRAGAVDLIGYLPYYRMGGTYVDDTLPAQLAMLDEVRYFGLTVDNGGAIVPLSGSMSSHLDNIATLQSKIDALPAAQRPRLDITLGGADQASTFATVAASASLRTTLAQNIDSLLDQTGATAVDIDWEHPQTNTQKLTHYPALLSRIKEEVGSDRRVYATVAPSVIVGNSIFSGPYAVDGVSLMTYDLGWWGNDPNNPNTGEHSLPEYVVDATNAWTEAPGSQNDRNWVFGTWGNNAPEEKLGVGMPFYGRNISNGAAYTYAELQSSPVDLTGNYYTHGGGSVWALDTDMAAERVQFAFDRGLQNIIIWEIAQDLAPTHEDSLLKAAYERKLLLEPPAGLFGDYNGNDFVDAADYTVWRDALAAGATSLMNDPTPGVVDESDFMYWRDHFGEALGGGAGSGQAIPEPSTLVALGTALFVLAVSAPRGRRRGGAPLVAH